MNSSRTLLRSRGTLQARNAMRTTSRRFQSTSSKSNGSAQGVSPAITGALSGATAALVVGYTWYHFSGTKTAVNTMQQTKAYLDSARDKIKENAPEPNEALKWLRQTTNQYAAFIPGAKQYIDTAFNDLDTVRAKHGEEVDKIVRQAYDELKTVAQEKGTTLEAAQRAWTIIQKRLGQIMDLAGDAAEQIVDNHPELKEKVGANVDQLKELGRKYGPEAKKQVDQTWQQIGDIVKGGLSADAINRIRKIVQEKIEQVKKMGDEAWKKGLEQVKPYLDKNSKVKELVEENADALKSGDTQELFQKIKQAVESGNIDSLQEYVRNAVDKAKQSGSAGLEQYLKMAPGGDQILNKLSQLQEISQKHGPEAEKLAKDTIQELQSVLQKKLSEAEKLADKVKKDTK